LTTEGKIEGKEEKGKIDINKAEQEKNDSNGKKKNGGESPWDSIAISSLPSIPPSSASSILVAAAAPGTQKETMDLDRVAIHHLTIVLAPLALGFAARYGQRSGNGGREGRRHPFHQSVFTICISFLTYSLLPPRPDSSLLQEEYTGWYSWALSTLTAAV